MRQFFIKSLLFWFVLLCIAIVNAVLREATYKLILWKRWGADHKSYIGVKLLYL